MTERGGSRVVARVRSVVGTRVAVGVPTTVVLVLATLVLLPAGAHGQVISGRVTEAATGAPVSAALVELLTADSVQAAATLTDEDGRYRLSPTLFGTFTLRVRRLGYATRTLGPVSPTGPRTVDVSLDARPVELDGLVATARAACADGPGVGPATQDLWDLIVGVLDVTRLAQDLDAYRFDMHQYVRELDVEGMHVLAEGVQRTVGAGAFVAVPVEHLADQGYVEPEDAGAMSWYMPDPEVLVSDHFLRTHCFRVVDGSGSDVVGLAFEPTPDRMRDRPDEAGGVYEDLVGDRVVDVRGVLWVDRPTGALRELEYEYSGLADIDIAELAGGHARFEQLAGGVWIVRQWVVRTPNLDRADGRLMPSSLREVGGYVVNASPVEARVAPGVAVAAPAERAVAASALAGTATGDLVGRLVAAGIEIGRDDAVIRLSGSPLAVRPDAEGRFAFRDVPPGPYLVTWWSPRLDSLDLPPRGVPVTVEEGEASSVTLTGPDVGWAVDRLCRGMPADASLGVVRVFAHDADGEPVSDRRIRLWSADGELERETVPRDGVATFCSVPTGVPLAIAPVRDPTLGVPLRLAPSEIRPIPLRVR